jgi:hypothetical protein
MPEPNPYTPVISRDVHSAKGERTRPLLTYWETLCGEGTLPGWQNFNLMDLYKIAPYLAVLDVEGADSAPKYRYRYVGSYLVRTREGLENADPTGKIFDEIPRAYDFTPILETFTSCISEKVPFLISGSFLTYRQFGYGERLIVPLTNDGKKIDKLVTCLDRLKEEDISK